MKLARVVVGVDFCGSSVEAARWTALHFAPEAEIVLAHAIDLPTPPAVIRGLFPPEDRVVETARRGAEKRFDELDSWTAESRVELHVEVGAASDVLIEVADVRGADVIVVGPHGCRPGVWDLLGSTAERVVREAACPVLVARGLPPAGPRRILVAVDGDDHADATLGWSRFLARRFDARVTVLHAVAPVWAGWEGPGGMVGSVDAEEIRRSMAAWIGERVEAAGFDPDEVDVEVVVGDPVHEILSGVARRAAELVVMGSAGSGALANLAGGSVTRAVLRGGSSPVFVVGPLGS